MMPGLLRHKWDRRTIEQHATGKGLDGLDHASCTCGQYFSVRGNRQANRQELFAMNWKDRYKAALIEVDPAKMLILIHDTEVAMSVRSESLPTMTTQEREEISDATCTLSILKGHAQAGCV